MHRSREGGAIGFAVISVDADHAQKDAPAGNALFHVGLGVELDEGGGGEVALFEGRYLRPSRVKSREPSVAGV